MALIGIKWAVMIRNDENLDLPGLLDEFKEYGEVDDIQDEHLDEDTPVKLIYISGSPGKFFRFKWHYNCVSAAENNYFLIPMENLEEKVKVLNDPEWKEVVS